MHTAYQTRSREEQAEKEQIEQGSTNLGGERLDGIPARRGVAAVPFPAAAASFFLVHARDAGQHLRLSLFLPHFLGKTDLAWITRPTLLLLRSAATIELSC
jgi:hypothetical protein